MATVMLMHPPPAHTLRNYFGSRPVASRCPTRGAEPSAHLADTDADDSGESDASEPVEESTVTAVGAAKPSEGAFLSLCVLPQVRVPGVLRRRRFQWALVWKRCIAVGSLWVSLRGFGVKMAMAWQR